jgi:hypothetical protein
MANQPELRIGDARPAAAGGRLPIPDETSSSRLQLAETGSLGFVAALATEQERPWTAEDCSIIATVCSRSCLAAAAAN